MKIMFPLADVEKMEGRQSCGKKGKPDITHLLLVFLETEKMFYIPSASVYIKYIKYDSIQNVGPNYML